MSQTVHEIKLAKARIKGAHTGLKYAGDFRPMLEPELAEALKAARLACDEAVRLAVLAHHVANKCDRARRIEVQATRALVEVGT